jgi:hypothetical protein
MTSEYKERLEDKLGEAIGLEMAAQKAVEDLASKGLLPSQGLVMNKLENMRKQASTLQTQMEDLVGKLSQSNGLDSKDSRDCTGNRTKGVKNNGNLSGRRSRFSRSIRISMSCRRS